MDEPEDGDRERGARADGDDTSPANRDEEDAAPPAADNSPAVPEETDGESTADTDTEADEAATVAADDSADDSAEETEEGGTDDKAEEVDADEEVNADDANESDEFEDEVGDDPQVDGAVAESEEPDFENGGTQVERKAESGGPPMDQEQPLAEHIEEMVKRLGIVVAVAGLVSVIVFPYGEELINFLWYSILPGTDVSNPHIYHPLELLLTQLKVASLAGLIVALPVFVYETYAFMRPGLYPHERRYYLAAIPTSLVLAFVGVTFAYFIVLPAVMSYFLYYSQDVANIAFALGQTFNLILLLMGYLAVVFQIPLFIMLAIMMGLTSREWLEGRRLIFWGVFAGISFLFSPDPTGMAPAIVALTMIVLFEGTLLLLRWTGR